MKAPRIPLQDEGNFGSFSLFWRLRLIRFGTRRRAPLDQIAEVFTYRAEFGATFHNRAKAVAASDNARFSALREDSGTARPAR